MKNVFWYLGFILIVAAAAGASAAFAGTAPSLELVSPRRGEEVMYGSSLVIAVSIYDPDGDVDITTAELTVNRTEVTRRANISAFLATYPFPDTTTAGRHAFTFSIADREGNVSEVSGFFNVTPEPGREPKVTASGSLTVGGEYDKEGDPQGVGTAELDVFGRLSETMTYAVNVEITNDELTDGQRASTYRLDLNWLWGSLVAGDTTPNFSHYTLNGKQILGGHFSPYFGAFGFDLVYGQSLRAVDDPETYRQTVYAGKLSIGNERKTQWSLIFVKAKDDTDSLSAPTTTPQDNVVLGTQLLFNLLEDKVNIEIEANESLLNTDISAGASDFPDNELPFDPESWEWLFVINEHMVPYVPGLANLAARGALSIGPFLGNTFNFEYSYVGPSFYSLANTGFTQDRAGFRARDSLWLLDSSLLLTGSLQRYTDNLQDTLSYTQKNTGYSVYAYAYPTSSLSFNGGFSTDTVKNDAPDGHAEEVDTVNTQISGGVTYTTALMATTSSLYYNGNVSLFTDRTDAVDDTRAFKNRLGAISYWSNLPLDTEVVAGYDFGDSASLPSVYLEGRAGYRFLPRENLYAWARAVYETGPEQLDLRTGTDFSIRYDLLLEAELQYLTSPAAEDLYISAFVTKEF